MRDRHQSTLRPKNVNILQRSGTPHIASSGVPGCHRPSVSPAESAGGKRRPRHSIHPAEGPDATGTRHNAAQGKKKDEEKLQLAPGLSGVMPSGSSTGAAHPERLGDGEPPSAGSISRAKRGKATRSIPKSWISRKARLILSHDGPGKGGRLVRGAGKRWMR